MPIDEDFVLDLDYAPETYAGYDAEQRGRWRTYSQNGLYRGVIWTNDEDGAGFLMGDEARIPGSYAVSAGMHSMFRIMKTQGVPAIMAYQAIQETPGAELGEEQTGKLLQAIELARSLEHEPGALAAAAAAPAGSKVNTYAAFDAHTEEFDELIQSDVRGISIYDSGGWHLLPIEDESQDGNEWIALSDEGIAFVKNAVDAGNPLTREDVLPFSIDN